ncbi:MAG: hypothetical protein J0G30_07565 [Actinomycetales bacterium]|nr:hypothetical protein [Actinomycetales bacterium]
MEIIYVTVIGAGIGLVLRYLLPHRASYGLVLLPCASAAVTAAIWAGLTWLGWTPAGGWIWVAALGAALAIALVLGLVLPAQRRTADERALAEAVASRS